MDSRVLEILQPVDFSCVQALVEEAPMMHSGRVSVRHQRETPINPHSNGDRFETRLSVMQIVLTVL